MYVIFPIPADRITNSDFFTDEGTEILEQAARNLSSSTIHPIPMNGSFEFDWEGNALPPAKFNYTVSPSKYVNTTAYQRCISANNCRPVHHANGWRPSFKSGYNATHPYGNGTVSRWMSDTENNLKKRQTSPGNIVGSSAGTTMNYGTVNPSSAFNNAYYICNDNSCETSSASQATTYLSDDFIANANILTYATGKFPSYNMRNFLIGAIVAAAGQGQTWWSQSYKGTDDENETLWMGNGADDITVTLFDGQSMEGYLQITTQWQSSTDTNYCADLTTAITDAVWAFASIFGGLAAAIDTWSCLGA